MSLERSVDMDESIKELSFVPSAVGDSAGCIFHDIASVMVDDDGEPHTTSACNVAM